ncbi:glycosyltransferase [Gleimia hominis]|uniref:Glycosyltransferase n=1 Tax=Gleimia hominis TaxID=595468 RepID=A0ABU3IAE2_9ACTO|nr:glycosyltransferase [Gleimia hominis]MDT3767337.1 glycosyltransferase [Gleimia hominis]
MSSQTNSITALIVTGGNTPYLQETIAAVTRQTRLPDRLLVIDWSNQNVDLEDVRTLHVGPCQNFGDALKKAIEQDPTITNCDWMWLLHDDAAPLTNCLQELERAAVNGPTVGAVGPKYMAWSDPTRLLSVGIKASRTARRMDDIAAEEIDQGQYDDTADVLAVGTAAMLVRTDTYTHLDGFDPALGPFGDGLEFGRRIRLAGYRVVVAPGAKIRHARASYRAVRDHAEAQIDRSYAPRRSAQIYNALVAAPAILTWVMLAFLPVVTALRWAWRVVTKNFELGRAEWQAMVQVLRRTPDVFRAQRRIRRTSRVPRSVLRHLEVSNREVTRAARIRARKEKRREPAQQLEPIAARLLRNHRARTRAGAAAGALITLILTVLLLRPVVTGLWGQAWVNLPDSWLLLVKQAWGGWVFSAGGYPGPTDPLLAVWALLTAPFAVFTIQPQTVLLWFWLLAPALAWAAMYAAAGAHSQRVALRLIAATVWTGLPTFLLAWSDGRLAAVCTHVALPLLVLGITRTSGSARPLLIRGAQNQIEQTPPVRSEYAAIAALATLVIASSASWTFALVLLLIAILLVRGRNHRWALLLTALPTAVFLAPTYAHTFGLGMQQGVQFLLAENGQALDYAAPSSLDLLLGIPHEWVGTTAGYIIWLLPTALVGICALGALASRRQAVSVRVLMLFAAASLVVANLTTRTVVDLQDSWVRAWPGTALSIAAVALIVAALRAFVPLCLVDRPNRATRYRRAFDTAAAVGFVLAMAAPLTVIGTWLPRAVDTDQSVQTHAPRAPLASVDAQHSSRHTRLLVLSADAGRLSAAVRRAQGPQLADSSARLRWDRAHAVKQAESAHADEQADSSHAVKQTDTVDALTTGSAEDRDLAQMLTRLVQAPDETTARALQSFAIDQIALAPGTGVARDRTMATLDSFGALQRAGESELGTLWRVRPDGQAPARLYADAAARGSGYISAETTARAGQKLTLTERADANWHATVQGQALQPTQHGWQQAFDMGTSSGTVHVYYGNPWLYTWWVACAVTAVGLGLMLIPVRRRRRSAV